MNIDTSEYSFNSMKFQLPFYTCEIGTSWIHVLQFPHMKFHLFFP